MIRPYSCLIVLPVLAQATPEPAFPVAPSQEAPVEDAIWIESESATQRDVVKNDWYGGAVKKDLLSGGDWLSHFSNDKDGSASYTFEAVKTGDYTFWLRTNPILPDVKWQIDGGEWHALDFTEQRGRQNLANDDKPDMRYLSWVNAGKVHLEAGQHNLAIQLAGGAKHQGGGGHHGSIDCLVFSRVPFSPQGIAKPSVAALSGEADWFPFVPEDDAFSAESVLDMSALVPAPAGRFGILQAHGKDLRFENAEQPVKLWGVGANLETGRYTEAQMLQRARYLRKHGINCVRQHTLWDDVSTAGKLDEKKLAEFDRWFATLKAQGIHMDWSVFYHFPILKEDGYPEELWQELKPLSAGNPELRDSYGLITISPQLWEIRNRQLRTLLTRTNPHTGLRYVDDPALAIVEMQNEDCVFFWNPLGALAAGKEWPKHTAILKPAWCDWVKKRYQTDEAVLAAWGRFDEKLSTGELNIHSPWELADEGPAGALSAVRAGDYIRFLAEMQRQFYEANQAFIRSLGFKGVIVTTAWHAGSHACEPTNTWTDTVGDMIDRHSYAGGGKGSHDIVEGEVRNGSHLGRLGGFLFHYGRMQVEDKPMCLSEWTMCAPTPWKFECAPIFAFYGMALQGWDASFHFAQTGTRYGDGWPGQRWYATDTPHYMGQFPALAFALHKRHFKEAPVVSLRRMSDAEVYAGRDILKQKPYVDAVTLSEAEKQGALPAGAFAIGRTVIGFGKEAKHEQVNLRDHWDEANNIIHSATGEMTWDYGREIITLYSPKTQGVIGRVLSQTITLPGVTATFKTPFVSTLFTPLDDLPLAESKHILITAMAQDRQTGSQYSSDFSQLLKVGTPPLLLEPVQAVLKFGGNKPATVRSLDIYGLPVGDALPIETDGSFSINGRYRTCYYELHR